MLTLLLSLAALADTTVVLSVEFPEGMADSAGEVWQGPRRHPVQLTNDGSLALDEPGDRTWWAIVPITNTSGELTILGNVGGVPLTGRLPFELPDEGTTTRLAVKASLDGARWSFTRTEAPPLPAAEERAGGTVVIVALGLVALLGALLVPVGRFSRQAGGRPARPPSR